MLRYILIAFILFSYYSDQFSQDFRWGLKGGIGYSFYSISKTDFSDPKGNAYTFDGTGGITAIMLGAAGYLRFSNSSFYFSPEFTYINGGGKIEFREEGNNQSDVEKTVATQKDQVFEFAASFGVELSNVKLFLGPAFTYRVTTDGSASNYLKNLFPNTVGETNSQSLYINLNLGIGYMITKNGTLNLRYSFPIVGNEFMVENNTYINNASFSLISIDYTYLFDSTQ